MVSSLTALDLKDNATNGVSLNRSLNVTSVLHGLLAERKMIPCQPCPNVTSSMMSSSGLGTDLMASGCLQFYPTEVAAHHEPEE